MLDNSGDSLGFPEAEVGASGVDQGRLAGLLLSLHARRFTGHAYVSAQSRTMTIAFRDGTPVMVDSSAPDSSLADDLVERGLLSRDEYADLIARVTEDLVENEDVAVCEHAVALGFLSEEQVKRELSERVRSKLIQGLSLVDCEFELDDSQDALGGVAEYPQKLGVAVYMGVRTFYEEDLLRSYVPDLKRSYMRVLKAPAEIARFFELDYEEVALLNAIDPQVRAIDWFEQSDLDPSHAIQLIALLVIGRMCEFSPTPFAPPEAERSGVRSAARPESSPSGLRAGAQRAGSRAAIPAAREEVFEPRVGSRAAIPAVREEVFEPRVGSRAAMPAVQSRTDSGGVYDPRVEPNTTPSSSRTEGSGAHSAPRRNPLLGRSAHAMQATPAAQPSVSSAAVPAAGAEAHDAAAEALAEARARVAKDGKRGGGYTRLGRDAKPDAVSASSAAIPAARNLTPAQPSPAAVANTNAAPRAANAAPAKPGAASALRNLAPPQSSSQHAAVTPEYQKAHLKELMQRKQHGHAPDAATGGGPRRDPARDFRAAQESLREGQFARAEEQLRGLVEESPADDVMRMYHGWAQLRAAHALDPAQLSNLRDLAKRHVSEPAHAGFACYVLAHLYLAEKKDEQAEKYFRKAHALDKTNKDAERHIVILERRKQQANEGETGGQRKLFGISIGKSKE